MKNHPATAPLNLSQDVFRKAPNEDRHKVSYNETTTEYFWKYELKNGSMLNIPLCDHNGTRISLKGCEKNGLSKYFVPNRNASVTLELCFDGQMGLAFVCESKELSMPLPVAT